MPTIEQQHTIISTLTGEFKGLKVTHGLTHVDTVAKKEELEAQVLVLEGLKEDVVVARHTSSGFTTLTAGGNNGFT
jgi:aspartate carbamoyltransferase catalytic subunit